MTYDQWKTESGYDERDEYDDYDAEDECSHEELDINWEGRATCDKCGESWWAYPNEIRAHREAQKEYDRWSRQQERREFWRKLTLPIRWAIFRLLERIWPRKSLSVLTDDEIPF